MVQTTMAWLSGSNNNKKGSSYNALSRFFHDTSATGETLQILSFETARIMSRLVSLYKSLSDDEFSKLRNGLMKSKGITFLNSMDEIFLLNLACAELLEELDSAAITVCRLGQKCSDVGLKNFDLVFSNLKEGIVEAEKLEFKAKYAQKIVEKMEKYVYATSSLHTALQSLAEMELSEKKRKIWKLSLDAKLPQRTNQAYLEEKLAFQRKMVKHYREISLWNSTFDKIAGMMASITCILYARICQLFGPFVSALPCFSEKKGNSVSSAKSQPVKVHPEQEYCLIADRHKFNLLGGCKSGPIPKSAEKLCAARFYSEKLKLADHRENNILGEPENNPRDILTAPPSTVGGAGLALRYANIITLAQSYLHAPTNISEEAREFMYELLPARIKKMIRSKLRSRWNGEDYKGNGGYALAEGWRDAVEEILRWLAPMAHDTVQWHTDRSLEKQMFDTKRKVLLFQTFDFSDLEKTEAAIAEVLVGLSCIYRYENRSNRR